ncbi:MAG: alkaline phosphatase family protein, partial [Planctomycetes bacterium]|nr:alkaline phosphatase family protein [Planctomycetota bacterium]
MKIRIRRREWMAVAAAAAAFLAAAAPIAAAAETPDRRAIVLGFDGVDPRLVSRYMADGDLPNIQALAAEGALLPLATTNPAESPVSWAAMSVGANPGHTGIFDFLRRVPGTYIPEIALAARAERPLLAATWQRWAAAAAAPAVLALISWFAARFLLRSRRARRAAALVIAVAAALGAYALFRALERYVPRSIPVPAATRHGTPYWQRAGECGIECAILHMPVTFPARAFPRGRLLAGLGTPDLRGTWGTYSVFASRFPERFVDPVNVLSSDLKITGRTTSVTGGRLQQLFLPEGERVATHISLPGPDNFTLSPEERAAAGARREVECRVAIAVDRARGEVEFDTGSSRASARAGEWTEWLEVDYTLNPLFRVRGIVRFLVRSVAPELYIYATPVNFHPGAPPATVAISAPADYARELAERRGAVYGTLGWATPTNPLKDELLTEDEFLDETLRISTERWQLMAAELARGDWRIFTGV